LEEGGFGSYPIFPKEGERFPPSVLFKTQLGQRFWPPYEMGGSPPLAGAPHFSGGRLFDKQTFTGGLKEGLKGGRNTFPPLLGEETPPFWQEQQRGSLI